MKVGIELNICSTWFDAVVEYTYTVGTPARVCGLPEDCYPAEPEEWEILSLVVIDDGYRTKADFLIDPLESVIIEELRKK